MWAAGVALYLLLGGYPPFEGSSSKELFTNILRKEPNFSAALWHSVSENAKDLILQLLRKNPMQRITAAEALDHPWFSDKASSSDGMPLHQSFEGLKRCVADAHVAAPCRSAPLSPSVRSTCPSCRYISLSRTNSTIGRISLKDRTMSFIKPSYFLDLQNRHRDSWGSGLDRSLRRIFSRNRHRGPPGSGKSHESGPTSTDVSRGHRRGARPLAVSPPCSWPLSPSAWPLTPASGSPLAV